MSVASLIKPSFPNHIPSPNKTISETRSCPCFPDANHAQHRLSATICPTRCYWENRTLILKRLLQTAGPEISFNIYVRSRSKLESLVPSAASDDRATIFEGSLQDSRLTRECLSDATTIICTVGENENIPGITVLRDCARAIIDALSALRASAPTDWTPPRLLFLSSATWNPQLAADQPALLHWMIRNAFATHSQRIRKAI
ncbi:hypothetical protein BDW75DRAFT_182262 [Aspergillus navahoensis]